MKLDDSWCKVMKPADTLLAWHNEKINSENKNKRGLGSYELRK